VVYVYVYIYIYIFAWHVVLLFILVTRIVMGAPFTQRGSALLVTCAVD
jgi:hypothetical protein